MARVKNRTPVKAVRSVKTLGKHPKRRLPTQAAIAPKKPHRYRPGTVALRLVNMCDMPLSQFTTPTMLSFYSPGRYAVTKRTLTPVSNSFFSDFVSAHSIRCLSLALSPSLQSSPRKDSRT